MPKPTKLHVKGKSNTLQKHCKVEKEDPEGVDPEESMRQFQLELCWCIQQLERSLREEKGNEKQMQEIWKVLIVLKNNNQPIIRKRQLMRTHFGDYRAKMAAEEKKLAKMASKIKISDVPDTPRATFVRKSAFLTTGDNTFRFNFNLEPEQVDSSVSNDGITSSNESNNGSDDNNTASNDGNNASNDNNTISNESNITSDDNKTMSNESNSVTSVEITHEKSADNSDKKNNSEETDSKHFKFSFSGSQFKFNFDVDK